jgi:hypothetical protein
VRLTSDVAILDAATPLLNGIDATREKYGVSRRLGVVR